MPLLGLTKGKNGRVTSTKSYHFEKKQHVKRKLLVCLRIEIEQSIPYDREHINVNLKKNQNMYP